jgi:hypothetical protein
MLAAEPAALPERIKSRSGPLVVQNRWRGGHHPMADDGFTALCVRGDRGVAFVTIDHPPINLLDMTLIQELDRVGTDVCPVSGPAPSILDRLRFGRPVRPRCPSARATDPSVRAST